MAIIPDGVSGLFHTIVSYLITMLTIMFFVKLVQIFTGLGGGRGGGEGGKKRPETISDDDVDKKRKAGKTAAEKAIENQDKRVAEDKFDPYNPGFLKFLVTDQDGNPLSGVKITVEPRFARKRKYKLLPAAFAINKDTWRKIEFSVTDSQGFTPSRDKYAIVGSGSLRVTIDKRGYSFINTHNDKHYFETFELRPGEERLEIVTLTHKGQKAEHFEPFVLKVEVDGDKLKLTGEIQ